MQHHTITLTHLNVRQSIAILLIKLITVDFLLSLVLVGSYFVMIQGEVLFIGLSSNAPLFLIIFAGLGLFKVTLTIIIVLQWLNEYYEITPEAIIHKKGIINKKTERYNIEKIRKIDVQNTFLGEICNYATVSLYDIRLNKILDMYLIHNPIRYAKILRSLKPSLEAESETQHLPFIPRREELIEMND